MSDVKPATAAQVKEWRELLDPDGSVYESVLDDGEALALILRIDELEAWQRLRDGSGRTAADIYRDLKEEVAYHKGKRKDAEAAQVAMYKELEELRQRAMHKFPPMPKAPWESHHD